MRAIVYARVSTDVQERDGTSLDTQERACLELAAARGWSVVRSIRDAASGFHLDRPGIDEVRDILRRGEADVLLSYAVDRLSRNQNHIGVIFDEVQQAGAQLEFVTERFEDTAIGRFILAARAFIAEVEREKIAERTMRGKAERARTGRLPQGTGEGLYGYRYDRGSGRRVVDETQAEVVRRAFEDFIANGTCHGIAQRLNAEGVPAFAGGRWHAPTVRRLLMNEAYTGRTVYRRTVARKVRDVARARWVRRVEERPESEWIEIEGVTPPIISRETFERAQRRMADPDRRRRRETRRSYVLRGRVRCGECDAPLVGHAVSRGRYHYYRCPNGTSGPGEHRCASKYVRLERLEGAVKRGLAEFLSRPERVLDEVRRMVAEAEAPPPEVATARAELTEVERRQARLAQLFTRSDMPASVLQAESQALADRRWKLEARIRELEPRVPHGIAVEALEADLPEILQAVRERICAGGEDDFALLLRAVDAQITATADGATIAGTLPIIDQDRECFATIVQTSA